MDYNKEVENMKNGAGNVFKPEGGNQYSVLFMEEPEETTFRKDDGTETPQIKCTVRVDNKPETENWYITKGLTTASLYGQLMLIGNAKGKLKGETINIIVKVAKGKDNKPRNDYSVVEAISLMKAENKEVVGEENVA